MNGEPDEALTPAEQRLLEHVETLRRAAPEAGDSLVAGVIGAARWQSLARPYVAAAGGIAVALAAGVQVLAGAEPRR